MRLLLRLIGWLIFPSYQSAVNWYIQCWMTGDIVVRWYASANSKYKESKIQRVIKQCKYSHTEKILLTSISQWLLKL